MKQVFKMHNSGLSADLDLLLLVQAFCSVSRGLKNKSHVLSTLDAIKERLGIVNIVSAWLPSRREHLAGHVRLPGWKTEWLESYDLNDFVHIDPVMKHLRRTTFPFLWSQALNQQEFSESEMSVMLHAQNFGLSDGYTVPFWGPKMRLAFITFATDGRPLAGVEKDALDFVALRLNNWLGENVDNSKPVDPAVAESSLAPHEIETLYLLMKGNNYKQIAYLSGLSTRTVESYVATATRKLKVHNRTEAILRALELGYINPSE
jgi:LuxR family quorum sensing-dependent transcriptional regulator